MRLGDKKRFVPNKRKRLRGSGIQIGKKNDQIQVCSEKIFIQSVAIRPYFQQPLLLFVSAGGSLQNLSIQCAKGKVITPQAVNVKATNSNAVHLCTSFGILVLEPRNVIARSARQNLDVPISRHALRHNTALRFGASIYLFAVTLYDKRNPRPAVA